MPKFGAKSTADDVAVNVNLTGKTAIVTGANTGKQRQGWWYEEERKN